MEPRSLPAHSRGSIRRKGHLRLQAQHQGGHGTPLVAVGLDKNLDARKNFAIPRTYYGITAVANFSGRRCTLSFEDPLATETTILQGRTFPLAADFTVPLAVMLASTNPKSLELVRVLYPQKYL
jgi:hypothetical protein